MKQYFPFTDYDFYAYLTAGGGLLFALDLTFNNAAVVRQPAWTFVTIILVTGLAYITGQLIASLSSLIFEHWFARAVLVPPLSLQLGIAPSRRRERVVARFVVGRYYEPLPENMRLRVLERAATALGVSVVELRGAEEVFQVAFPAARRSPDVAARMDGFSKLYGFNRNVALVAMIAAGMFLVRGVGGDTPFLLLAGAASVVAAGSFGRFLKFYAAYSAEMLRGYLAAGDSSSSMEIP
jgi:hypothetical protein